MMIDARHRHALVAHGIVQHAEPAEVGDVEHEHQVGPANFLDRLGRLVDSGQVVQEEVESRRRGRRSRDRSRSDGSGWYQFIFPSRRWRAGR